MQNGSNQSKFHFDQKSNIPTKYVILNFNIID